MNIKIVVNVNNNAPQCEKSKTILLPEKLTGYEELKPPESFTYVEAEKTKPLIQTANSIRTGEEKGGVLSTEGSETLGSLQLSGESESELKETIEEEDKIFFWRFSRYITLVRKTICVARYLSKIIKLFMQM